jgi:CheY-like chemotaxis protein
MVRLRYQVSSLRPRKSHDCLLTMTPGVRKVLVDDKSIPVMETKVMTSRPKQAQTTKVQKLKCPNRLLPSLWSCHAAPHNQNKPKERNLHGLCVDDNKINLRLLVTLMRREKHTYEQSENGQEALEIFQASNGPGSSGGESRQPFDFVLMDIGMPVMNGIQCTKAIREHERKHDLRPTYIVACTAWGDGQTQREAKEAGMDAFLPKPLKFAHLKELLTALMDRE